MSGGFAGRRAVRAVPLLLALAAALVAVRSGWRAENGPHDGTYLAYRLPTGRPIAFPIDRSDEALGLAIHVGAVEATVRFPVEVTVVDDAGATRWRGRAIVEAPGGGAIADGEELLTAARVLRLESPRVEGKLVVRVGDEGAGIAVVRLVRRAPATAPIDERTRRAVDRDSAFGWAYLPDEWVRELAERPIVRRAAAEREDGGAELVHVRTLVRERGERSDAEPGAWVSPRAGAAWTVRGGGRVVVVVSRSYGIGPPTQAVAGGVDRTVVEIETIDSRGRTARFEAPVGVALGFLVPEGDALTVTARCDAPAGARARAFVDRGATRLGDRSDSAADPASPVEIVPDHRQSPLWRVGPDSPALRATLLGDGTARVLVRPLDAAELSFRLSDAQGRTLAERRLRVHPMPSHFDVVRDASGEIRPASEPIAFVASAPTGSTLEIAATIGAADLSLDAPDDEANPRVAAGYDIALDRARLRHAPRDRRRWVPFRPDNQRELPAIAFDGQVRLEPIDGTARPGGPYLALEPLPPRTRQLLVERIDLDPHAPFADHARSGFAVGDDATLQVAARGADAGRLILDYLVTPDGLGGTLRVLVDDRIAEERHLAVSRGRIRLRGLAPGPRRVRVDGAPGLVLTRARGGPPFAERAVWRLDRGGSLVVPVVTDGARAKTLHVVLYTDDVRDRVRATAVIDGGTRGAGVRPVGVLTPLRRSASPPVEPTETHWLDRRGGASGRARFAVPLRADLPPGTHHVRITLDDGPRRVFARFYTAGVPARAAIERVAVEWDED